MPMHTLLLADESSTTRRIVEMCCVDTDLHLIAVRDGEEAIARIPRERPDIVVVDAGLSNRNGYEVARFVKEHPDLAHVPVVLLVGALDSPDDLRLKDSGCDGVLKKPFEPEQFLARVRELLGTGPGVVSSEVPEHPERLEDAAPPDPSDQPTSTFVPASLLPGPVDVAAEVAGDPVDAYLDQLTAAFADLNARVVTEAVATPAEPRGTSGSLRRDDGEDDESITVDAASVPTLEELLGEINRYEGPGRTFSLDDLDDAEIGGGGPLAIVPDDVEAIGDVVPEVEGFGDRWSADLESGERDRADAAGPVVAPDGAGAARTQPEPLPHHVLVTDALIEEVTQRVVERLTVVIEEMAEVTARRVAEEVVARLRRPD